MKVWMFFFILAAFFAWASLAIDCPPTDISPTPTDIEPNQVHFKLLCVKRSVEGQSLCVTLSACDPDGNLMDYRILQGPDGMQLTQDANEAALCWIAERGLWYIDIEVYDAPGDPTESLSDRGTLVFIIRKANQPPVFGGCR